MIHVVSHVLTPTYLPVQRRAANGSRTFKGSSLKWPQPIYTFMNQIFARSSRQRFHASSRAFLFAGFLSFGSSPARMKP
jgi:hypothetical protein